LNDVEFSDGMILAAGREDGFLIRKYTQSGRVETDFGDAGVRRITFPNGGGGAESVAVSADDKIVVIGTHYGDGAVPLTVVRLTSNGEPDATFGVNGVVMTPFSSYARERFNEFNELLLTENGKIVSVGIVEGVRKSRPREWSFALARHRSGSCGILGTQSEDFLVGTQSRDRICGTGGADEIRGLEGHDEISGGPGDDDLFGGPGVDSVDGGSGFDVCRSFEEGSTLNCEA
jgi:uncharacterized delta-60 repeat protein